MSQQILMGDMALLRAGGAAIVATPRGYLLEQPGGLVCTVACRHRSEDMERELTLMMDNGCVVEDIIVEHVIYGQLVGRLSLVSGYDVGESIRKAAESRDRPLSDPTGGIHLYTLSRPDGTARRQVIGAFAEAGSLVG